MIGAVVALGLATVLLAVALLLALHLQAGERREWQNERRALIDRVIAHHAGEVIALDRSAAPRPQRPESERPTAVGL
ncbi:MAG: hypothetical protein ABW122_06250 [Ilumatobacteraceae bacterium]